MRVITQLAPHDPHELTPLVAHEGYDSETADQVIGALRSRMASLRGDIQSAAARLANAEARLRATSEAQALLGRLVLEAQAAADDVVFTAQVFAPMGREETRPSMADDHPADRPGDTMGGGSFWWQILPGRVAQTPPQMRREPVASTPPPLTERVRVLRLAPPSGIPVTFPDEPPVPRRTRRNLRTRWYARPFLRLLRRAA